MKRIAIATVAIVALAVSAYVLADGIGAVKGDMVVQEPDSQAGEVVGFAICNTTANEDTIQVQIHLQGAAPDTEFEVRLWNVFYPNKQDDPVQIETVKDSILTNSEGNANLHEVTHVLEYGYADWVDMKVVLLAPGLKYSARFAPKPAGSELPPKP